MDKKLDAFGKLGQQKILEADGKSYYQQDLRNH